MENLRCLSRVSVEPGPGLNLITGANGAGKTSLLEAISVLSTGRSFLRTKAAHLITQTHSELLVAAQTEAGHRLGLRRTRGGQPEVKIDGERQSAVSALTRHLPVLVLGAEGLGWLAGTPERRRSLLDWGVFHVLGASTQAYSHYFRALDQRNKALKDGSITREMIAPWEAQMEPAGEQMHSLRREFFERLVRQVQIELREFPEMPNISFSLKPGFSADKGGLLDAWERGFERDRMLGSTQSGPHRADLMMTSRDAPVSEVLSRGQQKVLVSALLVAQQFLLRVEQNKSVVLLVDDLAAELDRDRQTQIWKRLLAQGVQAFVTQVQDQGLVNLSEIGEVREFHVEHGVVSSVSKES